jgi:superfamily II DNA or RNA helicase
VVNFELHDPLHVRIDTENWDYLRAVKEHFNHYVEGYKFMPLWKSGQWDGKISLLNAEDRTIPFGLVLDLIKFHKTEWSGLPYIISNDVKGLFQGITPNYEQDLLFKPYDYQDDCISTCLKISKGIIRSATASGKSLMISYVQRALFNQVKIKNGIIVVPSIGLVSQFYDDMQDYGINMNYVGRVGDDWREWNNPLVISTWQSLMNVPEHMTRMESVIVDEVHGAKAKVLGELLQQAPNARWRFGFTGTMPHQDLECLQVKSYLGPVLREYGSVELAELGYVAKCKINMIHISYETQPKAKLPYNEVKDYVFNNPFRMGVIRNIIAESDGSVLLLVGKVEDEGEVLKRILKESPELAGYEVEFLSGKNKAKDREAWRKYMDTKENVLLIATYGIFQQGINIKSLRNLILASPFKSKIRVLQSIGRALRLHADKKNGALVWDICDNVKFLDKHADTRLRHYNIEGFDVVERYLMEGCDIFESDLFIVE